MWIFVIFICLVCLQVQFLGWQRPKTFRNLAISIIHDEKIMVNRIWFNFLMNFSKQTKKNDNYSMPAAKTKWIFFSLFFEKKRIYWISSIKICNWNERISDYIIFFIWIVCQYWMFFVFILNFIQCFIWNKNKMITWFVLKFRNFLFTRLISKVLLKQQ